MFVMCSLLGREATLGMSVLCVEAITRLACCQLANYFDFFLGVINLQGKEKLSSLLEAMEVILLNKTHFGHDA